MKKIAYVGLPAHGHTNPTLPIMKRLVAQGHAVLFYNAESFRDKVLPTGVDFRPFPEPMPTEREVSEAMHGLIHAANMLSGMAEPLAHFLIDEFSREKPDFVIYDSAAMWGYIAARTHSIPNICFVTTFVLDGSQQLLGWRLMLRYLLSAFPHIPTLLNWRRRMAKTFGKENSGGLTEYADLNLVFTSKAFHPNNSFVDERFQFVGPAIDASTRNGRSFPFDKLHDGPKIYISLGTINNLNQDFYQAAFTAFADHPAQFILSVGKHTDIGSLGNIPANFIVENFVPQLELLQQVDAFITHGGMNSVHEGLFYGVPEIVVPQQLEQLLNGRQVAATRTGILLGEKRPLGQVTAAQLRHALDELLNMPIYRQNAIAIGQSLRAAGGYEAALGQINMFAGTLPMAF